MVLAAGLHDTILTMNGSSQYLHPDYLQPLPTTLDAKKSPLALLAQTCSNIGKDISPSSKTVIPPLEKKDGRASAEKTERKEEKREEAKKEERERRTPPKPLVEPKVEEKPLVDRSDRSPSRSPRRESRPPTNPSPPPERESRKSPSSRKATPVSLPSSSSSGHSFLDSHLYYSQPGMLDPLYATALAAHAGFGLKPGELLPHLAAPSPYIGYAQVKAANGTMALVPVCRDPYCTNCPMSASRSLACPSGCTQCNHDKPAVHNPALPFFSLGLSSSLGSLTHPSFVPHGLPFVCNWVAGSDHCGKRFNTSEELLRHLRTHTSSSEASALPLNSYSYAMSSSLSPYHGHLPPSLSPTSLHRAYPTSLSPLSSRYHPYKSSSSASSLSSPSLPSLPPSVQSLPLPGAYYSPYSFYASRLGAAAAP